MLLYKVPYRRYLVFFCLEFRTSIGVLPCVRARAYRLPGGSVSGLFLCQKEKEGVF